MDTVDDDGCIIASLYIEDRDGNGLGGKNIFYLNRYG